MSLQCHPSCAALLSHTMRHAGTDTHQGRLSEMLSEGILTMIGIVVLLRWSCLATCSQAVGGKSTGVTDCLTDYLDFGQISGVHATISDSLGTSPAFGNIVEKIEHQCSAQDFCPFFYHASKLGPDKLLEPCRRSPSPHDRYRRPTALPEELRPLPAHTEVMTLPGPLSMHDPYRPDLRNSMPATTNPFSSMYGDTMNLHHVASAAIREPSFALSPSAVSRPSPPRQHLLLEAAGHRQQPEPAAERDLGSMDLVGDLFTGLSSDTAILDRQPASLPALPAELTLSDRFQQLPETHERRHATQVSTEPLHITATAGIGRVVSFPQPAPVIAQPVSAPSPNPPASTSVNPTTLIISSIPHSCTTTTLVSILDQHHKDQYDFVHYQPSEEFDSTAVVNFTQPQFAHRFQDEMQDASWSDLHTFDPPTSAIASIAPHSIQGKDALLAHHGKAATRFGGAPGNESRLPSNRPLFFFCARKRPASAEHEPAPAAVRPRMPSSASHPAMQMPPSLQAGSRGDFSAEPRGNGAALKMEPDSSKAPRDNGPPLSPTGRLSRPASPSNVSDHDRAHVRSRPGSAAATSSRPPPGVGFEPLKITIKQEPGLAQPITPSPDSALDGMGHTLNMLEGGRDVSSSPAKASQPVSQQEAAAFLQTLGPELHQLQRRSRSPNRRHRSPSRHSHRHHSSSRQHSKSSRPSHAEKGNSRRPSHTDHKSSRGLQKVSSRDAKPPRDRSSKDRDSKHRSKPADVKGSSRSRLHQPADQSAAEVAAPKTVHVSVNAAPFTDQPSNGDRSSMAATNAATHAQPARYQAASTSCPLEEAVADNSPTSDSMPGLQQSDQPMPAVPAFVDRQQQQAGLHNDSRFPVKLRPAEFGGDFLSLSTGSP